MKTYLFKVYDKDRKKMSLTLDFENSKEFYRYLKINRLTLIEYRVTNPKYRIPKREIIEFTHNFRSLLESGMTITEALQLLSSQENLKINRIIKNIQLKIIEGSNLYSAFSMYKEVFQESYLNIILAGEESGKLLDNLERIYQKLLLEEKLKRKIKEAIFYPAIILIFTFLLIIFVLTFVFPSFIDFFNDIGTELPLLTRFLIAISQNFFLLLLSSLFSVLLGYLIIRKIEADKIERVKLKIPIYGHILKKRANIEFCRNFSIMYKAGIEVLNILEILKRGEAYLFQKKEFTNIQQKIRMGESIAEAFSKTLFFNPTQLYLIEIGEKSGTIEKTFSSIADTMEKELEFYLFKLISLLEPFLLLILGIIVGVIILGIYLPIFNITNII